jgi:hypothetical protein
VSIKPIGSERICVEKADPGRSDYTTDSRKAHGLAGCLSGQRLVLLGCLHPQLFRAFISAQGLRASSHFFVESDF